MKNCSQTQNHSSPAGCMPGRQALQATLSRSHPAAQVPGKPPGQRSGVPKHFKRRPGSPGHGERSGCPEGFFEHSWTQVMWMYFEITPSSKISFSRFSTLKLKLRPRKEARALQKHRKPKMFPDCVLSH